MKRIVVGTDLTPRSKAAVAMAAEMAEAMGATIHLVSACPAPVVAPVAGEMLMTAPAEEAVKATTGELEALASSLRRRDIAVEIHSCMGSAADVLCRVAETVDADLIVVGNKRMQGAGRLLGSVPNSVAHHAPCSVLIARTA